MTSTGEAAAEGLAKSRDDGGGKFISIEDLRQRAGISSAIIESLRSVGALDGMPADSQITLFGF